jgi:hypothetical protein
LLILLLVIYSVCRSIVSDFSWVCEEAWVPTLSQAMFFVGKHSKLMEKIKGGDPSVARKEAGSGEGVYTFVPSPNAVTLHM